jgi:uncharacterized DUF497 family protein
MKDALNLSDRPRAAFETLFGAHQLQRQVSQPLPRADTCAYDGLVAEFEWDPGKAAANSRKHGVEFADAVGVFEDERAITIPDTTTMEERFKTLGSDFLGRVIVVAYTYREDRIRLISARKATAPQRDLYERKRR